MLSLSFGVSDSLNPEGFYQYNWRPSSCGNESPFDRGQFGFALRQMQPAFSNAESDFNFISRLAMQYACTAKARLAAFNRSSASLRLELVKLTDL